MNNLITLGQDKGHQEVLIDTVKIFLCLVRNMVYTDVTQCLVHSRHLINVF